MLIHLSFASNSKKKVIGLHVKLWHNNRTKENSELLLYLNSNLHFCLLRDQDLQTGWTPRYKRNTISRKQHDNVELHADSN